MFDFLRKAIRAARNEARQSDQPAPSRAPLGLRRGGFVSVDTLPFRLQAEHLVFVPPEGSQQIEAYGRVDLGAGSELHRYYLSEDSWIQASTTGASIEDLKLWTFALTRNPATRAEFDRWLSEGSELGRQEIEFEGRTFRRVWGDDAAWAPPVCFDEQVFTKSDDHPEYTTTHHCMLFEREVAAADRMEYLIVSAELTGEDYAIVYSCGVDITQADLTIS